MCLYFLHRLYSCKRCQCKNLGNLKKMEIIHCELFSFCLCWCRKYHKRKSPKRTAHQMSSYSKYYKRHRNVVDHSFHTTCLCSPIHMFLCTVYVTCSKTVTISFHFYGLKTSPVLACYMIKFFQSVHDSFFHNAIA